MLTVGSLFAGIGGFDLGFERAGFDIKWQVEIDPFCRAVLEKHWPYVTRYFDVRRVKRLEPVDVICGGFPCQDISDAGLKVGIDGARSGLWSEFSRVVRDVRPRYVVVENVSALLGRGLGRVLGDLAESGYDAEWDCIPATAVGAPHRRDRVWVVAYPAGGRRQARRADCGQAAGPLLVAPRSCSYMADADGRRQQERAERHGQPFEGTADRYSHRVDLDGCRVFDADADRASLGRIAKSRGERGEWLVEPDVGRVAHGVPVRVDRLRGLGNAIVPQIAEWIAHRIKDAEGL